MTTNEGTIQVRSFRVIFDLERRIHKIDQWRVPLPYGLPLRSLGYFGVILLLVLIARPLPVLGAVLESLHPAMRYLLVPAGAAFFLTRWRIDGRLPLATGIAWMRMRLEPARIAAFRPAPKGPQEELGPITLAPDEQGARLRRGSVEGPAQLVLRYPTQMRARGRTLEVRQEEGDPLWRGKQVNLSQGQRLVIR
jgi:hypothetical protein